MCIVSLNLLLCEMRMVTCSKACFQVIKIQSTVVMYHVYQWLKLKVLSLRSLVVTHDCVEEVDVEHSVVDVWLHDQSVLTCPRGALLENHHRLEPLM
jgi:hypothetical protein